MVTPWFLHELESVAGSPHPISSLEGFFVRTLSDVYPHLGPSAIFLLTSPRWVDRSTCVGTHAHTCMHVQTQTP